MTQVILGKSRVREIRTPGSVRAKAEWLSYSTIFRQNSKGIEFVMLNHHVIRRLIEAHHRINRWRPWQPAP